MSYDIIDLIETHLNIKQKDLILEFLKAENYFLSVINSNEIFDREELIKLGKRLNILKNKIIYNKEEFNGYREYLSYIGIQAILSLKYIPEKYRMTYINEEFSGISGQKLSEIYSALYKKYLLINSIYKNNGEYGLIRYIFLNKKVSKLYKKTLSELLLLNAIEIDDIVNYTSLNSDFNKYNTNVLSHKIFMKEQILKNNNTIYL